MKVALYRDEEKMWDEYIHRSSQGTFFHRIGWKRVIEETFGYPCIYLYADDHGTIRGCLPLFHVKSRWFGNTLISVPFGVYGGVCADDPSAAEAILKQAREVANELGVDYVELRHTKGTGLDLHVKDLYVTFEREIYTDLDKNMEVIPRKQRRMIRQGIKHGLTSKIGGSEFLLKFYDIYAQSLRNLGTPMFPYVYFKHLMEEFGEQCRILSVWHQEKMVAAVMTFFYKDRVMPFYGGALKEYVCYAVNDFMYWELMRYGCEKGYKVFDFGRSRKGSGSFDFKRHWGFEPKPLPYQYYLPRGGTIPNISPANPKFKLFIAMWKRLPVPVTKVLGPRILRYLP